MRAFHPTFGHTETFWRFGHTMPFAITMPPGMRNMVDAFQAPWSPLHLAYTGQQCEDFFFHLATLLPTTMAVRGDGEHTSSLVPTTAIP